MTWPSHCTSVGPKGTPAGLHLSLPPSPYASDHHSFSKLTWLQVPAACQGCWPGSCLATCALPAHPALHPRAWRHSTTSGFGGGLHQNKIPHSGSRKTLKGGPGQAPHSSKPKRAVQGEKTAQRGLRRGGQRGGSGCSQGPYSGIQGRSPWSWVMSGNGGPRIPSLPVAPKFLQSQMAARHLPTDSLNACRSIILPR